MDSASTNLSAALMSQLEFDGTHADVIAGQSAWQNGACERHGGLLEDRLVDIMETIQPKNYEEWYECLVQALNAKNSLMKSYGFSAQQVLFGRDFPLPGCLLENGQGQGAVANSMRLHGEDQYCRSHEIRECARRCWLQFADSRAMRQGIDSRSRPTRCQEVGNRVAYWRLPKNSKRLRWYGRAVVIGHEGEGANRNLWLSHGGTVLRCYPEQERELTRSEVLGEDSVDEVRQELRTAMNRMSTTEDTQRGFVDLVGKDVPKVAGTEDGLERKPGVEEVSTQERPEDKLAISRTMPCSTASLPQPQVKLGKTSHTLPSSSSTASLPQPEVQLDKTSQQQQQQQLSVAEGIIRKG